MRDYGQFRQTPSKGDKVRTVKASIQTRRTKGGKWVEVHQPSKHKQGRKK